MAQPTTQLNATEQDTLVKQIGLALLRAAPRDWRRVTAEYRAVGRYHEMTGEIVTEDGTVQEWVATHDIATLFGRLRGGMYRDGRGTWFNARYQLDHPSSYNLEYNRDEPSWNLAPPPQAYSDELRMYPRSEENVPEWVIRRMSGLPSEQPGPRFRIARIFDAVGPAGRPVINRPDLEVDEQDRLLDYLDSAPLVVTERGYDVDRLAQTPEATVPVAFHSDGVWIWPAAVNFYLRAYAVSPENDLVEHIRGVGFTQPPVDDQTLQAAGAYLQPPRPPGPVPQQAGPPPQAPPLAPSPLAPGPPPPLAAQPAVGGNGLIQPAFSPEFEDDEHEEAHHEPAPPFEEEFAPTQYHEPPAFDEHFDDHPDDHTSSHTNNGDSFHEAEHTDHFEPGQFDEAPAEAPAHAMASNGSNGSEAPIDEATTYTAGPQIDPGPLTMVSPVSPVMPVAPAQPLPRQEPVAEELEPVAPPEPPAHQAPTPERAPRKPEPAQPALRRLWTRLDELDVPADLYSLGEPADHGWSVEETEAGWRVGWYDGELTNPAVFGDAEDATAFMLGKLLLNPSGGAGKAQQSPEPEADPIAEASAPVFATLSPEVATGTPEQSTGGHALAEEPEQFDEAPIRGGLDTGDLGGATATPPAPVVPLAPPLPPRREPPPPTPTTALPMPPLPMPVTPPIPQQAPPPPPRREEPVRPPAAAAQAERPGSANQQWPIGPMAGEPPLTLFRGKEMRELPAGSELDRFGGPNGNLTYAAGTPYEERSLVPEWVNRPYHVYRVQRSFDALAGVAIPWFNQPGGGAAYLLPASIEELLADGDLIELDPGEPPID